MLTTERAPAGNRALRRLFADVRRTVGEGDQTYGTLAEVFGAVSARLGSGVNPLHLRAVLSQFNHDNRRFDSAGALDSAARAGVQALAAANSVLAWTDERLEATTSVGGTAYTFTMSYKHLGETYRRGDRGSGAANTASDEGNTILTLGDGAVAARFQGLVDAVRASVLVPASSHPHQLGRGTSQSHQGTNWVTEGTSDIHVYPTDGADTVNLTNAEYRALVAFAGWRAAPTPVSRGEMLSNETVLTQSAAKITQVTGVVNVPTLVAMARVDQRIDWISSETTRIDAAFAAERVRIATTRAAIGSRQWAKPLQERVATGALATATQTENTQAGIVAPLGLSTLVRRVNEGTVSLSDAEATVRSADAALRALMAAATSLQVNFKGAVEDDNKRDADGDDEDMLGGMGW
ncbi:MAG: hypothetical protein AB7F65_12185 [Dehalococcoidia bacterium]